MELEAPCVKTECLNGGHCTKSDENPEELCECAAGFVGRRCEIGNCSQLKLLIKYREKVQNWPILKNREELDAFL